MTTTRILEYSVSHASYVITIGFYVTSVSVLALERHFWVNLLFFEFVVFRVDTAQPIKAFRQSASAQAFVSFRLLFSTCEVTAAFHESLCSFAMAP